MKSALLTAILNAYADYMINKTQDYRIHNTDMYHNGQIKDETFKWILHLEETKRDAKKEALQQQIKELVFLYVSEEIDQDSSKSESDREIMSSRLKYKLGIIF